MGTFPFDRTDGDMVTQFQGMVAAKNQFLKEPTPIAEPITEMTVKDLLPMLTTTDDRKARIKAMLTPAKATLQHDWWYLSPIQQQAASMFSAAFNDSMKGGLSNE